MADLYCLRLGESMRNEFAERARSAEEGKALLVLPNTLLVDEVRQKNMLQAVNIDYLPNEILRSNGLDELRLLSRQAQEVIVGRLLEKKRSAGALRYFANISDARAFVKTMTNLIGELARADVSATDLEEALNAWSREGREGCKDKEILDVCKEYEELLALNNLYDMEGLYRLATKEASRAQSSIPWEELFFSDFYRFDRVQLELLKVLAKRCRVTVGIVGEPKKEKLYAATLGTIGDLSGFGFALCRENPVRARKPELQHFCDNWLQSPAAFADKADGIKLISAVSAEDEMRMVLEAIKQELLAGTSYDDILLVVRSLDSYSGLRNLLDEYGIPTTLPKVTGFFSQPLVEMLKAFFALAVNSFDMGALCDLVGSGFAKLLFNLESEKLLEARTRTFFATPLKFKEYARQNLSEESFLALQMFIKTAEAIPKEAAVAEFCSCARSLVKGFSLKEKFGKLYRNREIGMDLLKNVLLTENMCLEVFDEIEKAYDDSLEENRKIKLQDFINIFKETGMGKRVVLEKGRKQGLRVLEASKVQGLFCRHVYLMGLREGEFPSIKQENWLYNDKERTLLSELGVELQNSVSSLNSDQYFFASTIAAAAECVTLSSYADEGAGVSGYIEELKQYYPGLRAEAAADKLAFYEAWSDSQLLQKLSTCKDWPVEARIWAEQLVGTDFLSRRTLDKERFNSGSEFQGCLIRIAPLLKQIFNNKYNASMLESYAFCPFRFLVEKVWRLGLWQEISEDTTASEEGDFYHTVLARFLGGRIGLNIAEENRAVLEQELYGVFEKVFADFAAAGKIRQSAFAKCDKDELWTKVLRLVSRERQYQEEIIKIRPRLLPSHTEWSFGGRNEDRLLMMEIDGQQTFFDGRIDRIDADEDGFFITDYKKSFLPSKQDFMNGLDMQLPVYLLAAQEMLGKQGLKNLGGGYFSIRSACRKNGFWSEDACFLPWVKRGEKDWEQVLATAEKNIAACVRGVNEGNYFTDPRKNCPQFCPGRDICRYSSDREASEESGEDDA